MCLCLVCSEQPRCTAGCEPRGCGKCLRLAAVDFSLISPVSFPRECDAGGGLCILARWLVMVSSTVSSPFLSVSSGSCHSLTGTRTQCFLVFASSVTRHYRHVQSCFLLRKGSFCMQISCAHHTSEICQIKYANQFMVINYNKFHHSLISKGIVNPFWLKQILVTNIQCRKSSPNQNLT